MLLGSIAGSIWLAREGNGWSSALPAYTAVLGALLLVEAHLLYRKSSRPRATEALPGMVVAVPQSIAEPETPESARQRWRMPIWLHVILQVVVTVPGFFGGAILGFCTTAVLFSGIAALLPRPEEQPSEPGGWRSALGSCCLAVVGVPLFFGGAALGAGQAQRLLLTHVPARCPKCGGAAYCKVGRPITYHCRFCGHVHATKVQAR
jgi:hypothetical protein